MDEFTKNHFESWLEDKVADDVRDQVRKLMLHEYNSDPEIYDRIGWSPLYNNIHYLVVFPKD